MMMQILHYLKDPKLWEFVVYSLLWVMQELYIIKRSSPTEPKTEPHFLKPYEALIEPSRPLNAKLRVRLVRSSCFSSGKGCVRRRIAS